MPPKIDLLLPSRPQPTGPARLLICEVCDNPGAETTVERRGHDVELRCQCGAILRAVRVGGRRRAIR